MTYEIATFQTKFRDLSNFRTPKKQDPIIEDLQTKASETKINNPDLSEKITSVLDHLTNLIQTDGHLDTSKVFTAITGNKEAGNFTTQEQIDLLSFIYRKELERVITQLPLEPGYSIPEYLIIREEGEDNALIHPDRLDLLESLIDAGLCDLQPCPENSNPLSFFIMRTLYCKDHNLLRPEMEKQALRIIKKSITEENINAYSKKGHTPLTETCDGFIKTEDLAIKIVELLLQHDSIEINKKRMNNSEANALQLSIDHGVSNRPKLKLAQVLIDAGADHSELAPLLCQLYRFNMDHQADIARFIMDLGYKPEEVYTEEGTNALEASLEMGSYINPNVLEALDPDGRLRENAHVDNFRLYETEGREAVIARLSLEDAWRVRDDGETLLSMAIEKEDLEMVAHLLKRQNQLTLREKRDHLEAAFKTRNKEILEALLEQDFNPDLLASGFLGKFSPSPTMQCLAQDDDISKLVLSYSFFSAEELTELQEIAEGLLSFPRPKDSNEASRSILEQLKAMGIINRLTSIETLSTKPLNEIFNHLLDNPGNARLYDAFAKLSENLSPEAEHQELRDRLIKFGLKQIFKRAVIYSVNEEAKNPVYAMSFFHDLAHLQLKYPDLNNEGIYQSPRKNLATAYTLAEENHKYDLAQKIRAKQIELGFEEL